MEARWKNANLADSQFSYHCYQFDGKGVEEVFHAHDRYELVLIIRGNGEWCLDTQSGDFKGGTVLLVSPQTLHSFRSANSSSQLEAIVVHFPKSVLPRGLLSIEEAKPIKTLLEKAKRGLIFEASDAERIRFRMQALLRSKGMFRIARLHVLLELIAQQSISQVVVEQINGMKSSTARARFLSIKRFINEHCEKPIGRSEVAAFVEMDEASFSRLFHREAGVTFSEYLAKVRIQSAARWLMIRKDFSIAEVARRSGFKNLSSFNKQFKKRLGMTPLAYRKAADIEPLAP
ncbi:AraC family transcriptional regulator [Puniceicoccaceae bacterium K14]|nr:AraC family transcriptional regulator [Puniceicoccaceae bacterium K14]